jgi:hypothetical protein
MDFCQAFVDLRLQPWDAQWVIPGSTSGSQYCVKLRTYTMDGGDKLWCFLEDNLLLFHVSLPPSLVH